MSEFKKRLAAKIIDKADSFIIIHTTSDGMQLMAYGLGRYEIIGMLRTIENTIKNDSTNESVTTTTGETSE